MAVRPVSPTHPLAVPLAVMFLHVANVAFGIFLGCLFFHPLLDSVTVRADTDSSVPDVKDDGSQVAVPIGSLHATHVHSFQEPPGDVLGNLGAAAGGDGKDGF